jgi:hypothetical protein
MQWIQGGDGENTGGRCVCPWRGEEGFASALVEANFCGHLGVSDDQGGGTHHQGAVAQACVSESVRAGRVPHSRGTGRHGLTRLPRHERCGR